MFIQIDDEFLEALPDSDDKAFVAFVDELERQLEGFTDSGDVDTVVLREYISFVLAFLGKRNPGVSIDSAIPSDSAALGQYFQTFRQDVVHLCMRLRLRVGKAGSGTTDRVVLSDDARNEISDCIEKIRKYVNAGNYSDVKRQVILEKLNALSLEIDAPFTRQEKIQKSAISLAAATSRVMEEAEPAVKVVLRLLRLVEDNTSQKLIEPPRKKLPPPESDDEIPF